MKYQELNKTEIIDNEKITSLNFLYKTVVGRIILKILTRPMISKFVGFILNLPISKPMIYKYIKKYNIKVDAKQYKCFNDFFKRKIEYKLCSEKNDFISTADSKITAFDINEDLILDVKNSKYSIKELIKDEELSENYRGGICIIYRLSPENYHRYIFPDFGIQTKIKKIQGILHSVNPVVYEKYQVFTENTREVSLLETENFGNIIQIEVGALCIGKIQNHDISNFNKYDEKGFFEFGGSTIIQLIEKDKVVLKKQIMENSQKLVETKVLLGNIIGKSCKDEANEK